MNIIINCCILVGIVIIIGLLIGLKISIDYIRVFVYGELTNANNALEEIRNRLKSLEQYICGRNGHFEDSIKNGSSLNGSINAILFKLSENDLNIESKENKNNDIVFSENNTNKSEEESIDNNTINEESASKNDKISFEEEDFIIEEE